MGKRSGTHTTAAFRRSGINDAGYVCPRFNLESRRLAWLKTIRSASSRAAANAVMTSNAWRSRYENAVGPERILISMYEMDIIDLHPGLNGLRIVQLTDIHHGPWLPIEFVDAIVEKVNNLKPDIVALTGDYVINSPRYIKPVVESLKALTPHIATVAVMGNHDWWEGGHTVVDAFENANIPLLDNRRLILTPDRELVAEARQGLCLAGVGDPWADTVDFDAALGGMPRHIPRILLSHNPDCAEDRHFLKSAYRVDLMLSGHTHGGQVCFPGNRQPVLPKIRKNKYARGLVFGPQCPVYICRGIGTAGVPLRLGSDPEIAVFDLVSSAGASVNGS
jgi:predicted MPP superfamily phosphohydrolase